MPTSSFPKTLADHALRLLKRAGVDYADVRLEAHQHESLVAENGRVSSISTSDGCGLGVRVFDRGGWGFAATPHLTAPKIAQAVRDAVGLARATSMLQGHPRSLAPLKPAKATYATPHAVDPFTVPLSKKIDYLLWANTSLLGPDAIRHAATHMDFYKHHKLFLSTEGACIEQTILESGAGLEVTAQRGNEVQTRSAPNSHRGALAQAGYEYVKQLDLVGAAKHAQEEVLHLLRAEPPRSGPTTLILHPTQVVMQLHESCGHPTELDRALGHELSYAGGSFLTPDHLGSLQYGSRLVNIVADATVPRGVGSFAYDDEGVPAQCVDLVRKGRFVGYLSSRESSAYLGLPFSGGAMRAERWDVPPIVRMTNVNLEPGDATLEELLKDVKQGYLVSTNKSWSIDDKRLNFQFTTEIGWEIENGKLARIVKNPLYTGITPQFWGRCTGVGRPADWQLWGVPNCAKGEPMQTMHVGHGSSYARFDGVTVSPAQ
jgi:TldD protein